MQKEEKAKCNRCENKSFLYCSKCDFGSNFKALCSYDEYKRLRKEETQWQKKQRN